MATDGVDDGSLQADSQSMSVGLVLVDGGRLALSLHSSKWTECTLAMTL